MNHLSVSATLFASIQWLFFIFANTVVVPVSIGEAFQLPPEQVAFTIRSSFIITGLVCVLQGWRGHRYPLLEGHSGIWWGLILSLTMTAPSVGMTYEEVGGGLTLGILLAGAVTVLMGAFNSVPLLQRIFTPMVMSVYLLLLAVQLILIFFKGMLKVTEEGQLDLPVSFFSIGILLLVSVISIKGKGLVSNFAILIGIMTGWVLYVLMFPSAVPVSNTGFALSLFPWGKPQLELGVVLTAFVAGMLNASNTLASIRASEKLHGTSTANGQYRWSFTLTGMFTCLAAVFGLVPYAPFTSSIGFLESTRILDKKPFLIGGAMFALLGMVPALGALFSTLPMTVGNAVLFVAYLQLFGTALRSVQTYAFNSKTIYRFAFPVLVGISLMNVSPEWFGSISIYVRPLVSNGLLMGILLSIVLEKAVKWEKYE